MTTDPIFGYFCIRSDLFLSFFRIIKPDAYLTRLYSAKRKTYMKGKQS